MARKARSAPVQGPDPFEPYSTWDIRIARGIFYYIILASITTILGVWVTIFGNMITAGLIDVIFSWGLGGVVLVIFGVIAIHLFALVLFYVLFRGGVLKLCKKLFKDRLVAKKYEDYSTLRLLLAVTLLVIYLFIITFIFFIMPQFFWEIAATFWAYVILHFSLGEWILLIGFINFIIVILIYLGFVLWNHGVFAVLKRVKRIEEEQEIKEEIKKEELKALDDTTLQKVYQKQTGRKAIYRGKETKEYIAWKKEMLS
jgi:hypothetical protein